MGKPRYFGLALILIAGLVALPLVILHFGNSSSMIGMLLAGLTMCLPWSALSWIILTLTFGVAGIFCVQVKPDSDSAPHWLIAMLLGGIGLALLASQIFLAGIILLALSLVVAYWEWDKRRRRSGQSQSPEVAAGEEAAHRCWSLSSLSRGFFALATAFVVFAGISVPQFLNGQLLLGIFGPVPVKFGPIPRGTPVNLIMNLDPDSPYLSRALGSMIGAMAEIKQRRLTNDQAWKVFSDRAGELLLKASKCPDFVLDRGHFFGETLDADLQKNQQDKEDLIAFLKTL